MFLIFCALHDTDNSNRVLFKRVVVFHGRKHTLKSTMRTSVFEAGDNDLVHQTLASFL